MARAALKNMINKFEKQNDLVFQPIHRYFKIKWKNIFSWKSKGLSDETNTSYGTSGNSLTPLIDYYGSKVRDLYFKDIGFKYEKYLCNGWYDLMQKAMCFNYVAIVYVKGNAYRTYFWGISKDDVINIMNGSNLIDKMSTL